jgi:multidrug efflux pump subunit AcrA (membrane-fusion protein)
VETSKQLQLIVIAGCLLPTAFCILTFAQGGTGKLPPRRNPPPPIRRPTPRPPVITNRDGGTRSTAVSTVVGSGEVRPARYVNMVSEVSGRVQEIYVTPGDEVSKCNRARAQTRRSIHLSKELLSTSQPGLGTLLPPVYRVGR